MYLYSIFYLIQINTSNFKNFHCSFDITNKYLIASNNII